MMNLPKIKDDNTVHDHRIITITVKEVCTTKLKFLDLQCTALWSSNFGQIQLPSVEYFDVFKKMSLFVGPIRDLEIRGCYLQSLVP